MRSEVVHVLSHVSDDGVVGTDGGSVGSSLAVDGSSVHVVGASESGVGSVSSVVGNLSGVSGSALVVSTDSVDSDGTSHLEVGGSVEYLGVDSVVAGMS